MRLFDGPIALLPCVTYKYYQRCNECKDEETCGIRSVFADVRNETLEMLKKGHTRRNYPQKQNTQKEKIIIFYSICLLFR